MPCTAHIPVPRSQIGSPTEIGGPSVTSAPTTAYTPYSTFSRSLATYGT
jgi:hypothetical protein